MCFSPSRRSGVYSRADNDRDLVSSAGLMTGSSSYAKADLKKEKWGVEVTLIFLKIQTCLVNTTQSITRPVSWGTVA